MNTSNIPPETLDYAGSWSWPLPNERVMSEKLSQWHVAKSPLHDRRLAPLPDPRRGLIEIGSRPISAQESVI